jgi:hypothetical protein
VATLDRPLRVKLLGHITWGARGHGYGCAQLTIYIDNEVCYLPHVMNDVWTSRTLPLVEAPSWKASSKYAILCLVAGYCIVRQAKGLAKTSNLLTELSNQLHQYRTLAIQALCDDLIHCDRQAMPDVFRGIMLIFSIAVRTMSQLD